MVEIFERLITPVEVKNYRDAAGNFAGQTNGDIPAEMIECSPPVHSAQKWDGANWIDTPEYMTALANETLADTDQGMIRVVEDLIEVLKVKGLIVDADLPVVVRGKLAARQAARGQIS